MDGFTSTTLLQRVIACAMCISLLVCHISGLPVQNKQQQSLQQQPDRLKALQRQADAFGQTRWPSFMSFCSNICRSWDSICLSDCAKLMPPSYRPGTKRSALPFDDKLGNLSFDDYIFLKMVGRL